MILRIVMEFHERHLAQSDHILEVCMSKCPKIQSLILDCFDNNRRLKRLGTTPAAARRQRGLHQTKSLIYQGTSVKQNSPVDDRSHTILSRSFADKMAPLLDKDTSKSTADRFSTQKAGTSPHARLSSPWYMVTTLFGLHAGPMFFSLSTWMVRLKKGLITGL
ncbi:hypothetical protein EJB05_36084 [Eragrostis curvula]|uniref:Uncharacterized protein n=1 Tax=Eragrostis curvula TaxID=38414 RepID=A0A5J9U870_9POAL|nr:hypothetical protein EJB05_36084 [Eragrostis curvula]